MRDIMFSRTTEDTELGTKALDIQPDDNILVVGGSGDQVLDAMCFQPETITVVDSSADQLGLCRLKTVFAKYLSREEFIVLQGYYENGSYSDVLEKRMKIFLKLYALADRGEQSVLESYKDEIFQGIADLGQADFPRVSIQYMIKVIEQFVSEPLMQTLLGETGDAADRDNIAALRFLHKMAAKLVIMAPLFVSPRLVKESSPEHLQEVYANIVNNFYRTYQWGFVKSPQRSHLFARNFESVENSALPMYMREENFTRVQKTAQDRDALKFVHADLGDSVFWDSFLGPLDKAYLSSVPVWVDATGRETLFAGCHNVMRSGSLIFTCSHDTLSPLPESFSSNFEKLSIHRHSFIGDRPSPYVQELLLQSQ